MSTQTERDRLLQESDDLLFAMRMLAASEDVDQASVVMKAGIQLLVDATAYHAKIQDEAVLSYVRDSILLMADHIKGLPSSNRSATAKEARKYRMSVGADVYHASRDRDVA